MRKIVFAPALLYLLILSSHIAPALPSPRGEIVSITVDGVATINTGLDVGFETGDILVLQRNGAKVALAHVTQVTPSTAVAKIMKTEPGMEVRVGDIAAYQMLTDGMPGFSPYYRPAPQDEVPNIIRKEWQVPPISTISLDKIIDMQMDILSKQPYNRDAMLRLGDAYFRKTWYEHSIRWYQKAIETSPNAEDTDKLIYQIIRCLGYLNQPEKQAMYINFLNTNYPNSVFASLESPRDAIRGSSLLDYQFGKQTISDIGGLQKKGMTYYEKDRFYSTVSPYGPTYVGQYPYTTGGIGQKLLSGEPDRLPPSTLEPSYYDNAKKYYDYYSDAYGDKRYYEGGAVKKK